MPILYAIVSYIAVAALLPVLLFHPKLRHGIRNRLGLFRTGERSEEHTSELQSPY